MENFCRAYLVAVAKAFSRAEHIALTTVSRRFHGDVEFFDEFARGDVTVTLRKYDQMLESFRGAWPKNRKFPSPRGTLKL